MVKLTNEPNISGIKTSDLEIQLSTRTRQLLLTPLRVIGFLTIITGLFALVFEVRHFHEHSFSIYYARYIAITVAFWVLTTSYTKVGIKYSTQLVHILLFTIIASFGWMIYILPKTLMLNSSIAALTIFTASVFLSWDVKNQIIVAIYYNLSFAASIFLNKQNVYAIPNVLETVILVMFLSILSIVASGVNFHLRRKLLVRSIHLSHSEKKYKDIFNSSVNGLFQLSKNWEFVLYNPALRNMLGIEEDENLIGVNFPKEFFKDELEVVKIQNKLKETNEISKYEIRLKKKNLGEIVVKLNLRVIRDKGGNIEEYEGSIENITHEVRAKELLIDAKNKAELSDKLKSEFLAQMSHEIRTPLNAMLTSLNVIQDDVLSDSNSDLKEYFEIIDYSTSRIMRTIDLILDMSEMESGAYQPNLNKFDIYDKILSKIYKEYQTLASRKSITLKLNNSTSHPIILADEYTVEQIFLNLVDNAIKYTDKGKVDINVYRNFQDKVAVDIIDTGTGINKEYIPYLFDPFSQEDQGYSRKFEGNGLGMALVRKYIDLNRADIEVESEKGRGSKFTVIFNN